MAQYSTRRFRSHSTQCAMGVEDVVDFDDFELCFGRLESQRVAAAGSSDVCFHAETPFPRLATSAATRQVENLVARRRGSFLCMVMRFYHSMKMISHFIKVQ